MKYIISLIFCLLIIMLCFGIEYNSKITEIEKQTQIKLFQMQETINQQEKEIRLLKTDMEIINYGFERTTD